MLTLIRVDASSTMGVGHLMRCLALAQSLQQSNMELVFAVNPQAVDICRSRHDWVGKVVGVPQGMTSQQEARWLCDFATEQGAQVLILDGYHFDADYRLTLCSIDCVHVCFDDNNELEALHADVVINGASNADALGYQKTAPDAVYCFGETHRVMRQEFVDLVRPDWTDRRSLTVSFGGSDPYQFTLPLLTALEDVGFEDPIRIITGVAYEQLDKLKGFLQHSSLITQHLHNCQYMADAFAHSKLTISAAGGSQFELMAAGSPAVLVVVADNQLNATQQAAKQGWCEMLDGRIEPDFRAMAQGLLSLWRQGERLEAMSRNAYACSDTQGAARVTESIRKRVMENTA